MKTLVSYSGGKDSLASLLFAIHELGVKKDSIEAVFCDTGFEYPETIEYIHKTTNQLGVKLVTLKSNLDFFSLAMNKKRMPSPKVRFCTEILKIYPMIDYILQQQEHLLILQGIRALESKTRSKMNKECRYFKYYFEPYNTPEEENKQDTDLFGNVTKQAEFKPKYFTYRKEDVNNFISLYSDDLLRPVFTWTGKQVLEYILKHGLKPNPLYYKGFDRVGCKLCINSKLSTVKLTHQHYPETIEELIAFEKKVGSFFPSDKIPEKYHSGKHKDKTFPFLEDVLAYVNDPENQEALELEDAMEGLSCMTAFNICE